MTVWVFCEQKWGGHSNDDFYTEYHAVYLDREPTKEDSVAALIALGVDDFNKWGRGDGWHKQMIEEGRVFWIKAEKLS